MPASWKDIPTNVKEIIVFELDAVSRANLSMCSKLDSQLVRGTKNGKVDSIELHKNELRIFHKSNSTESCISVRSFYSSSMIAERITWREVYIEKRSIRRDWKETIMNIMAVIGTTISVDSFKIFPNGDKFEELYNWFISNVCMKPVNVTVTINGLAEDSAYNQKYYASYDFYDHSIDPFLDWSSDVNIHLDVSYHRLPLFEPDDVTSEKLANVQNVSLIDCDVTLDGFHYWLKNWLTRESHHPCSFSVNFPAEDPWTFIELKTTLGNIIERTGNGSKNREDYWLIEIKKSQTEMGIIELYEKELKFKSMITSITEEKMKENVEGRTNWNNLPSEMKSIVIYELNIVSRTRLSMCSKFDNQLVRTTNSQVHKISLHGKELRISHKLGDHSGISVKSGSDDGAAGSIVSEYTKDLTIEKYSSEKDLKETISSILSVMGSRISVENLELHPSGDRFEDLFNWFRNTIPFKPVMVTIVFPEHAPIDQYNHPIDTFLDWPSDVKIHLISGNYGFPKLESSNAYSKIVNFASSNSRNNSMTNKKLKKLTNATNIRMIDGNVTVNGFHWWLKRWLYKKECVAHHYFQKFEFWHIDVRNVVKGFEGLIEKKIKCTRKSDYSEFYCWKIDIRKNEKEVGRIMLKDTSLEFRSFEKPLKNIRETITDEITCNWKDLSLKLKKMVVSGLDLFSRARLSMCSKSDNQLVRNTNGHIHEIRFTRDEFDIYLNDVILQRFNDTSTMKREEGQINVLTVKNKYGHGSKVYDYDQSSWVYSERCSSEKKWEDTIIIILRLFGTRISVEKLVMFPNYNAFPKAYKHLRRNIDLKPDNVYIKCSESESYYDPSSYKHPIEPLINWPSGVKIKLELINHVISVFDRVKCLKPYENIIDFSFDNTDGNNRITDEKLKKLGSARKIELRNCQVTEQLFFWWIQKWLNRKTDHPEGYFYEICFHDQPPITLTNLLKKFGRFIEKKERCIRDRGEHWRIRVRRNDTAFGIITFHEGYRISFSTRKDRWNF